MNPDPVLPRSASAPPISAGPAVDIVLRPHRSLSPAGFWVVMSILAAWSFIGGIVFWLAGAWPIIGFLGIDVALVYWAFRASYGDRRAQERLSLADGTLTVRKVDKHGAEERFIFPSYWLRVSLEERPDGPGRLLLSSHGRHLAVGAFLAPDERAALARELSDALGRARAGTAG